MKSIPTALLFAITGSLCLAADATTQPASLAGESHQIRPMGDADLRLRPRDANSADGTPIVLYPSQDWKCMTWKLEPAGDGNAVRLMNYFTRKTFYPDAGTTAVTQHKAAKTPAEIERWRFIPTADGAFRLEHVATGKTLTIDAAGKLTMQPYTGAAEQQWKLVDKPEHFTG